MNKNISALYERVKKGDVSKSHFMKEVRREFPNLITQYNSFKDTVKILKGKSFLFEREYDFSPYIKEEYWNNMDLRAADSQYIIDYLKSSIEDLSSMDTSDGEKEVVNAVADYIHQKYPGNQDIEYKELIDVAGDYVEENGMEVDAISLVYELLNDLYKEVSRSKPNEDSEKELNEEKDARDLESLKVPQYSPNQLEKGLRVELEEMGVSWPTEKPSWEDYEKATEKAKKNLEKDPLFYIRKDSGQKEDSKRTDVMVPAKDGNTVDKDNGMQPLKESQKRELKNFFKKIITKTLSEEKYKLKATTKEGENFSSGVLSNKKEMLDLYYKLSKSKKFKKIDPIKVKEDLEEENLFNGVYEKYEPVISKVKQVWGQDSKIYEEVMGAVASGNPKKIKEAISNFNSKK